MRVIMCVLVLGVALCFGCVSARESVLSGPELSVDASDPGDFDETLTRAQRAWSARTSRERLIESIALYERAVLMDSKDPSETARRQRLVALYTRIARAYHLLGREHLEPSAVGERGMLALAQNFERGVLAAERALALSSPDFASAAREQPLVLRRHFTLLRDDAMGALFWYSANLAGWSEACGPATVQVTSLEVEAGFSLVDRKTPALYHAGASRELASWIARHPAGDQDFVRARAFFERAVDISPNYVANRFLYARDYAIRAQDESIFVDQLELAGSTNTDLLREFEPENQMQRRRARRLLEQRAQHFSW